MSELECPLFKYVCKGVNCAWWVSGEGCAIHVIATKLHWLTVEVRDASNNYRTSSGG